MTKTAYAIWERASQLEEEGRIREAITLYQEAISAGSIEALINLANIYDDTLKPSESEQAVHLYMRAVQRGSSVAAWNLYRHFANRGERNQAGHWLKIAAELGDEDALKLVRGR